MVPPPRNWRGVTCWLLGGTAVVKIRTVAPPLYLNEILRGDYCRYFHDSSPPSVIYEGTTVRIGGTTVGGTTDRKGIGTCRGDQCRHATLGKLFVCEQFFSEKKVV
jgi:hypothetical protein